MNNMTNYLRTCYRITGGKIDDTAIGMGVTSTPTTATALGTVEITHGLGTTPTVVFASPYAANTLACWRYATLAGIGSTYATFIVVSAPIANASQVATSTTASTVTSQVTMTFVWLAVR